MSGGGGGIIIIGDESLVQEIKANISKVAPFRVQRAQQIIALYSSNENAITRDMQQFLLRCAADIVDNS
jgi:hypothetical protein